MEEIAPEVPQSTFLKDVIRRGFFPEKTPISVPQVSAVTAATADKNKTYKYSVCMK